MKESKLTKRVINICSNKMGRGDDDLGDILIQSFVNTLIQLDPLPSTIILYNSAVLLCTEDSAVLDSLKALELKNVNILVCGTCADFYNIKDKIAVGTISNMYAIVETLNNADRIINP